jgi:hypothetical protein
MRWTLARALREGRGGVTAAGSVTRILTVAAVVLFARSDRTCS